MLPETESSGEALPSSPLVARLGAWFGYLCFGVAIGGVGIFLLACLYVYREWQGQPIYFLPPGGPGIARPGTIPDALALDYGRRWFQERYSFQPQTIDAVHTSIAASLDPHLSRAFETQRTKEAKEIKQAKMSSQATALKQTVLRRTGAHVWVQVDGLQTVLIGQEEVQEEPLVLTLVLGPWERSGVPQGIQVLQVSGPLPTKFLRK